MEKQIFEILKAGCPWKDDNDFCTAQSCIGWGGTKCDQKNCAPYHFMKQSEGNMKARKEEIIEHITQKIPYPEQIEEWDLTEQGAVRFTWRGDRFRASSSLTVEQVEGGLLRGSNIAILLQKILKK